MNPAAPHAPLFSVIVPVYRAELWLARCVESILGQTMPDFELLLIDDGSPDGSGAICDEYGARDSRVRVFHKANEGVAKAREFGVARARGQYLIWVDSDDWIEADLLEKVRVAHEEKGADMVVYGMQEWSNGQPGRRKLWEPQPLEVWQRQVVHGMVNNLVLFSSCRSLWEGETLPECVALSGEDNYMVVRLILKARSIESLPGMLYHYWRDNEASLTHAFTGWRFAGNAWGWYYRFQVSRERFPDEVSRCAKKTLSAAVKAYAVSLLLHDLTEGERARLADMLRAVLPHAGWQRFRDQVLARSILAGHLAMPRWYAAMKLRKEARRNEQIRRRREESR